MHHMKRDWEKKYNLLHKKNPAALYIISLLDKRQASLCQAILLRGQRITYQQDPCKAWRLEAYEDTNTRGQKAWAAFSLYQSDRKAVFKPGGYYNPKFIKKLINNPSKKPINSQQMDLTVSTTT